MIAIAIGMIGEFKHSVQVWLNGYAGGTSKYPGGQKVFFKPPAHPQGGHQTDPTVPLTCPSNSVGVGILTFWHTSGGFAGGPEQSAILNIGAFQISLPSEHTLSGSSRG